MKRKGISFRLRADMDADLIEATKDMEASGLSDLCRNGLRLMLGIRKTKQVEVRERALILPEEKEKTDQVYNKPASVMVNLPKPYKP